MNDTDFITIVALGTGRDFIGTFENLRDYLRGAEEVRIKNIYMEELTLSEALRSHDEILNWDLSFRFTCPWDAATTVERLAHEIPEKFIRVAAITNGSYLSISDVHGNGILDHYLSDRSSEEIIQRIVTSLESGEDL